MDLAVEMLVNQLKEAHKVLEETMDGVSNEVGQWQPEGTANPIAGTYAHLVFSEDMFLHGFLKQEDPLFETMFKDATGASAVQPSDWVNEYPKWLREVEVDMEKFRAYAKAVYASSEEYVAGLSEEDLVKDVDMSAFGMGSRKVHDFIGGILVGHAYSITGEVSVLKGLQGLKGYPF